MPKYFILNIFIKIIYKQIHKFDVLKISNNNKYQYEKFRIL
jgi:hypothetical protein